MTFARSLIKQKGAEGGSVSVLSGGGAWRLQEEVPGENTAKETALSPAGDPGGLGRTGESQVRGQIWAHIRWKSKAGRGSTSSRFTAQGLK